jgi:hypothetical protein
MLAGLCSAPGIAIDDGEATRLAEATQRVLRWYDIPEIGEKATDHYGLAMAVGMIYGTRFFAWLNSSSSVKAPPAGPQPRPVPAPSGGDQAPRGDGSLSLVDVNLGRLDVPPLPGAQAHTERQH